MESCQTDEEIYIDTDIKIIQIRKCKCVYLNNSLHIYYIYSIYPKVTILPNQWWIKGGAQGAWVPPF